MKDLWDARIDMMLSARKHKQLEPLIPLYIATREGDLEEVKRMVKQGANPLDKDINDDTLMHFAAQCGSLEILKYLIEDVNCNPATEGQNGNTVLHTAAEDGQLSIIKYLVEECNVEVTLPDAEGFCNMHQTWKLFSISFKKCKSIKSWNCSKTILVQPHPSLRILTVYFKFCAQPAILVNSALYSI